MHKSLLIRMGSFSVLYGMLCAAQFTLGQEHPILVPQVGHSKAVTSVAFSPDGKTLASGSKDNTIILWDVETGKQIMRLQGHTQWVESVSFSPDGKTLASPSNDNTIILWDVQTGKQIMRLWGHNGSVESVSFSPDGKTLASGS